MRTQLSSKLRFDRKKKKKKTMFSFWRDIGKIVKVLASLVAQLVKNPLSMEGPQFDSWVDSRKMLWRRE